MKRFFLMSILVIAPVSGTQGATLFLADYDGDTGNSGLDADLAVGSPTATAANGSISGTAKWGAGALDPTNDTSLLSYATAGNFNLNAGTVEMWLRTDTWNSAWGGFFNAYIDNSNDIRFWKRSDGRIQATMNSGAGGVWNLWGPVLNLDSDWYHVAWTWDFTANTTTMYLDGTPLTSSLFFTNITELGFAGTVDANFEVGAAQNGLEFQGQIDDFRISDVDLYGGQSFTPPTGPYPIPEPGSLYLLMLGTLFLASRQRLAYIKLT